MDGIRCEHPANDVKSQQIAFACADNGQLKVGILIAGKTGNRFFIAVLRNVYTVYLYDDIPLFYSRKTGRGSVFRKIYGNSAGSRIVGIQNADPDIAGIRGDRR